MIKLENISKSYSDLCVFSDFNLQINKGEITAILGESGCGKTTLLNLLANLTEFSGKIIGNEDKKAVVFQENRLIDALTVRENLMLVNEDESGLNKDLEDFGLTEKADSFIKALSGGMARRVAILRALRYDAPLILMDEPFINLDLKLKNQLIEKLKEYQKKKGVTIIIVTHDIFEAVNFADRILVLQKNQNSSEITKDVTKVNQDTVKLLYEIMSGKK